jgi:two-component system, OmpR family, KDP operon response regulator KdpE
LILYCQLKMSKKNKILVIDDEPQIRKLLRLALEAHEYEVIESGTGRGGLLMAASHNPDLVLLDLNLPDEDGGSILRNLKEWSKAQVIILSVRSSEDEKIKLLDSGADDYITKPFHTGELLARIRVALRHTLPEPGVSVFHSGTMQIDFISRIVKVNDIPIKLTATEYSILILFAHNAGKVLTHKYILQEIWGNSFSEDTQYLRVFIAQIRKKIEENPSEPKMLVTESGVGYRLNVVG